MRLFCDFLYFTCARCHWKIDAFVKDLEDEDRSPEELAAIRTAAENMDMEKVWAYCFS